MTDEFERWYDLVHIPEILERYPQIVSVVRYRLSPSLNRGVDDPHDSLAVYEVEGSAAQLWPRLVADTSLTMGAGFDYTRTRVAFARSE
jgi:hypothetical protein